MLLNDSFLMTRVARKTVVLPFAALLIGVGIVLASLQLSHAAPSPGPNAVTKRSR